MGSRSYTSNKFPGYADDFERGRRLNSASLKGQSDIRMPGLKFHHHNSLALWFYASHLILSVRTINKIVDP